MSSIDNLSGGGIASITWNTTAGTSANLPEKSLKPLGDIRPTYIERVFNTQGSDSRIEEALSYRVANDQILTPANYQDILEQLRQIAANAEGDETRSVIYTRTYQLLDELAGNIHLLNLNRQTEASS